MAGIAGGIGAYRGNLAFTVVIGLLYEAVRRLRKAGVARTAVPKIWPQEIS